MESVDYQNVISDKDIRRFPISITTTEVNLTGSWRFYKPVFKEKISPCSVGCPANTNIPKYIHYLLKNDMDKAAEILRRENPFPATCGRVCPHFCQSKCNRKDYDGAVEIKQIERFVGDYALKVPPKKVKVLSNKKVAIVGGGPAGLSCAYFLALSGYRVDVFEKERFLGGLLVYGIPDYRLPKEIPIKEIENILEVGNINVNVGVNVNREKIEELKKEYNAVFVALGLSIDKVPGDVVVDNKRVFSGYELLKEIKVNGNVYLDGDSISVLGGGNVAFDIARSIRRLGKDVNIICMETLETSPAFEDEKKEAIEEGIKVIDSRFLQDLEFRGDGLHLQLRGVDKVLDNYEPVLNDYIEGIDTDILIVAIGRKREESILGTEGVFFGGDFYNGAKTVIEAIASGKKVAFEIVAKLEGKEFKLMNDDDQFFRSTNDFDEYKVIPFERINLNYFSEQEPIKLSKLAANERVNNFNEVVQKPSLEKILREAKRCFSCGVCNECKTCWFFCPDMCIDVHEGVNFDYSFCKGCGVCSEECPRGVIEMVEDK